MFQTDVDVVVSSESHSPSTSFPSPHISVSSVSCLLTGADHSNSSLTNSNGNGNSSGSHSPLDAHSDSDSDSNDITSFAPSLLGSLNPLDASRNRDVDSASSMYDYEYYYYYQDTLHYRPRRSSKHYSPSSIQSPSIASPLTGKLHHLDLYDHPTPTPIPTGTITTTTATLASSSSSSSSSSSTTASSIYPYSLVMKDRPSIVLSTPIQSSILKRRRSTTRTGTRKMRMSRRRKIATSHDCRLRTCSNTGIDDGLLGLIA